MCIQHFTLAKFRPTATAEQKEDAYLRVSLLLFGAAETIPGIKSFQVGPPISKRGTRGYEFAVIVEFQDMQAFIDFIPHAHHQMLADVINDFSDGKPLSYQIDTTRPCAKL
ncbi:Stress-response A/B barrel domain-containing protein [Mycena sanguinolenta]|uniref:Stress-response A/B barrel domain-containing protein n=1 Tax=Mycena sanguinolenta TaxID=230812 RepID=A0A8H6ZEC1_9AGAR|nr:Stress-response A/B barrel domain-containing protein [Mycena sanguinolenta]